MNICKKTTLSLALCLAFSNMQAEETATNSLNDVTVVSARGFEQNITDAPATISVITSEELEKKSYTDVTDALKNVPGVYINGGGSNQSVMIRGMQAGYTLYLIDGRPMQNTGAFERNGGLAGAQSNFLPPMEAIERIEVIRGPASSLYGSDAMGGVINIITKKHSDKVTGSITSEFIKADSSNEVNNDSHNTSVFINAPVVEDLLSFQLTAGYLNSDESDFKTTDAKGNESDPEFERKNIGTKFIFTPDDNNTITAGYNYSVQERWHHVGASRPEFARNRRGDLVAQEDSYSKSIKYNYNLNHEARYDDFLISSYVNYDKAKNPTRRNSRTGKGIEFDTLTLNTQGTYFFDNNTTTLGLNYKDEHLEDGSTNSLSDDLKTLDRYQYAFFLENEWNITDDLALTLSGRFDENEDFGSNFSPKVYAVYRINENWTVKGGATAGYKAPDMRDAATDFGSVSRGGTGIGNPDLKPEKSMNYEAGIAYSDPYIGLNSSLTAYVTDYKDKILRKDEFYCEAGEDCTLPNGAFVPAGENDYGFREMENVDKAQIRGIEFTLDYQITKNLTYRHSYTFTESERKSGEHKGSPLNDLSKHMFNAGLDWDATKKLNLWTQVNYRSETVGAIPDGGRNFGKQPSYTFADVGLVYDINNDVKLKAGIYNVTNKKVDTDNGYHTILDGRRYSFALNYKF